MKRNETMKAGILAAAAAFSLYMGIKSLFIDGYLLEYLFRAESLNMMGELLLIFLWNLYFLTRVRQRRWQFIGVAAALLAFLWCHQSFLPVLAAGLYTCYLMGLGFTLQKAVGFSGSRDMWLQMFLSYLLGSGIWITVVCLFSAMGMGGVRLYRMIVLFSAILLILIHARACLLCRNIGIMKQYVQAEERKQEALKHPKAGMHPDAAGKVLWAVIITMCLLQIGRMNIALDYDSLHYGLRSLYILDNGAGIYENLGTVNQVYTYSKGFEVLALPLSGTATYGYVLAFNMWVCAGIVLVTYAIVRKLSSGFYGVLAAAVITCIPGIMNMGITAKSDCITLLFQLFFIYFLISYLKEEKKEVHYLIAGGCACLMTYIFKPTSMVFSTVLIGMSFFYFVYKKVFIIWKKSRAWLFVLPAVSAWLFLWARTYLLTGYPVTSVFTSIWDKMGFRLKYPFSFFDIPAAGGKLCSIEGLSHLAKRMFHMLFAPAGDDMFHVRIAWGTGLMAFLLVFLTVAAGQRRKAKPVKMERKEERDAILYLYVIFLPLTVVSVISIRLLWQVDGNYFMLFYALVVILSITELSRIEHKILKKSLSGLLIPLLVFNVAVTCLTNWSGALGLTPVKLIHKGYYNHLEEKHRVMLEQGNQDIWNRLSANPRTRVLAMGDHPQVLAFPCNVQSYYDVTGSGGNVFLVKTLDNFKGFLRYAGTEYVYVQSGYLTSGSRVRDIVRYMLEDNSLANVIYEGGNMLLQVNLDGAYEDNPKEVLEQFYQMYPDEERN